MDRKPNRLIKQNVLFGLQILEGWYLGDQFRVILSYREIQETWFSTNKNGSFYIGVFGIPELENDKLVKKKTLQCTKKKTIKRLRILKTTPNHHRFLKGL